MYPKYPYVLAIVFGLGVNFIPEMGPFPLSLLVFFFVGGILFGFLWPKESWRWGLWIVGPTIGLILLSVLFAGHLEIFLTKDLPMILLALAASCLGSFTSAWFRQRRGNQPEVK